jgi:hypothetical protein
MLIDPYPWSALWKRCGSTATMSWTWTVRKGRQVAEGRGEGRCMYLATVSSAPSYPRSADLRLDAPSAQGWILPRHASGQLVNRSVEPLGWAWTSSASTG